MSVPIPNLTLSTGPAVSDANASGAANSGTGSFDFGSRDTALTSLARLAVPVAALAFAFWWTKYR